MRIHISHSTFYKYDTHVPYTAQLIRLHPRNHAGQQVLSWRVTSESGRLLPSTFDGYGNVLHMLTRDHLHDTAAIIAAGEVETTNMSGIVMGAVETLPPKYFLRQTAYTRPDAALTALAQEAGGVFDAIERLHGLMLRIRWRVVYETGATESGTTAAEALSQGRGVCQDHTHIFLSAARVLGYPARYVTGYLSDRERPQQDGAGHAWAEAMVEGLGWIGFDVANGICPDENYVRVATGLDFMEAAPIRGVRRGEGDEEMRVSVDIRQGHQLQQ
jgi:transglutaminase-like putative cysteine protease